MSQFNLDDYENEYLLSRSQAKQLIGHFCQLKQVVLDFKNIESIGPAFADEIFRVFAKQHPQIKLKWVNANKEVEKMIKRALAIS